MKRYGRLVLSVVFLALLATPALMRRLRPRAVEPGREADARQRYGMVLTESAKAAGLDFVHEAPTLDSKLDHIMPQVSAMGADLGGWSFGAQFGDLNNDGLLDLYLVNGFVSASRSESCLLYTSDAADEL